MVWIKEKGHLGPNRDLEKLSVKYLHTMVWPAGAARNGGGVRRSHGKTAAVTAFQVHYVH